MFLETSVDATVPRVTWYAPSLAWLAPIGGERRRSGGGGPSASGAGRRRANEKVPPPQRGERRESCIDRRVCRPSASEQDHNTPSGREKWRGRKGWTRSFGAERVEGRSCGAYLATRPLLPSIAVTLIPLIGGGSPSRKLFVLTLFSLERSAHLEILPRFDRLN